MVVQRLDSIPLDTTYFTAEGYLVDHPIVTRTGIFEYRNPDGSIRKELRTEEEVFNANSLNSYKGKPIIITHEAGAINVGNVHDEQIGTILSPGYQDNENVRAEIIIHDTEKMKNCGLRELSLGYSLELDETPGMWNGEHYDAIQKSIVINHLALVSEARAGDKARLNIDSRDTNTTDSEGGESMAKNQKDGVSEAVKNFNARRQSRIAARTDSNDNNSVETNLEGQDIVNSVLGRRAARDDSGDPENREDAMDVIAEMDEDIDALFGVIDVLRAINADGNCGENKDEDDDEDDDENDEGKGNENGENENNDSHTDSKDDFRELLRVVRIGDKLNMDGLESMSVTDAKKAVIGKVMPTMNLDSKSDAYISAAFDMAVDEKINKARRTDSQRHQIMNNDSKNENGIATSSAAEARARMINRRNNKEEN